jgi:hypothetical protein
VHPIAHPIVLRLECLFANIDETNYLPIIFRIIVIDLFGIITAALTSIADIPHCQVLSHWKQRTKAVLMAQVMRTELSRYAWPLKYIGNL